MATKSSVTYSYSFGRIDCDEECIGESGRTFYERFKVHLKAPSPIFGHQNSSGHETSMENFKIIGREENSLDRTIKEAMYMRVNNPPSIEIMGNTTSLTFGTEFCLQSQN